MGLHDLTLTPEEQKKIKEYNEEKTAVEAKRVGKIFGLFQGRKLTVEEKKRLYEIVQKHGVDSEIERNFNYAVNQVRNKKYSPAVIEKTNLCIANFKQCLKDDEYLQEQYGKYLDENGEVKNSHRLWLLERMEGYLSSDMYKRPLYSNYIVEVIFFLGTNGKISPRQEAEQQRPNHGLVKAAL